MPGDLRICKDGVGLVAELIDCFGVCVRKNGETVMSALGIGGSFEEVVVIIFGIEAGGGGRGGTVAGDGWGLGAAVDVDGWATLGEDEVGVW